jgi:hypothetical protein
MKTIILSTALLLLSFLSFGHTITYSISYSVGDSLTVYTNDNAKDFKKTLLYVRTMLHDDFENARILEADFNRVEAYIQAEIESLILEPIKTKMVNQAKAKQSLNVPKKQQAKTKDIEDIIYVVYYGIGEEVISYESNNLIDYVTDLQDVIDFLNEDFLNERISLQDLERINAYFNSELDKIFSNKSEKICFK